MPDGEEDEGGAEDQRQHVAESGEGEGHGGEPARGSRDPRAPGGQTGVRAPNAGRAEFVALGQHKGGDARPQDKELREAPLLRARPASRSAVPGLRPPPPPAAGGGASCERPLRRPPLPSLFLPFPPFLSAPACEARGWLPTVMEAAGGLRRGVGVCVWGGPVTCKAVSSVTTACF